ncbi:MAG: hypothetical protein IPK66_03630 [Rhodospirillales bacterium]|nr:hypothetical protein [Rhodospirillales bacterium]
MGGEPRAQFRFRRRVDDGLHASVRLHVENHAIANGCIAAVKTEGRSFAVKDFGLYSTLDQVVQFFVRRSSQRRLLKPIGEFALD